MSSQLPTSIGPDPEPSRQPVALETVNGAPVTKMVTRDSDWVIARIESIFESFADAILEDRESLSMPKMTRTTQSQRLDAASESIEAITSGQSGYISFPGKTPHEAWRFSEQDHPYNVKWFQVYAVQVRVLELIREALVDQRIITKRDIYYIDPTLFVNQSVVDRCVDNIACTFGVRRASLNVVAAAKGLVVGALTMKRTDGSLIDFTCESEGQLVPNVKEIGIVNTSELEWVLVIEKEATFRSLAASAFWKPSRNGKGLLLTAKGYPDLSTRLFLRLLSEQSALPPATKPRIYALVDFDPDGMAILSTYKYGSMAMAHENAHLNVDSIRWIGVRNDDICSTHDMTQERGFVRLTARDRRLAVKMLEKGVFAENGPEREWRRELQVMLIMNIKAEIQQLSEKFEAFEKWLEGKISLGNV